MKRKFCNFFVMFLVAFILVGCGKRYDLTRSRFETQVNGTGRVAVCVLDSRSFVISGEKPPTFIGLYRGGSGIPEDVFTRTGNTVARDVVTIVQAALASSGFSVRNLKVRGVEEFDRAIETMDPARFDRVVALDLNQLKVDSWAEVEFEWDIGLRVYDGNGELLVRKQHSGLEESLKRNYLGSISSGQAQHAIAGKISHIFKELFDMPEIKKAMTFVPPSLDEAQLALRMADKGEDDIAMMKAQLESGDRVKLRYTSRKLYQQRITDRESLDRLAQIIWDERARRDGASVNALCYLCKIFMKSKDPRYTDFFVKLSQEGKTRHLRKYAIRTRQRLGNGAVEQFVPLHMNSTLESSGSFAQEQKNDPLDVFLAEMFQRHINKTLCKNESDTFGDYRTMLIASLQVNGINKPTPTQLGYSVWTLFPCPFRPDTRKIKKATGADISGGWVYPKSSQHLRFGSNAGRSSLTHPLPTECEIVGYYDNNELRSALLAGQQGCIIRSEKDFMPARKNPVVSQWELIEDGRVKVTRTDIAGHIEEWDVYLVEEQFVSKGVTFRKGDLISYLRKEKNNETYNASTQFRHLVKLPKE